MNTTITKSRIKKGDTVAIKTGKDAGKKGVVEKVYIADQKILVKGINLAKKHIKPKGRQQPGQIITLEKPVNISNIMMICPNCNKETRVAYKMIGKTKQRVCKKCSQVIEAANTEIKKK